MSSQMRTALLVLTLYVGFKQVGDTIRPTVRAKMKFLSLR